MTNTTEGMISGTGATAEPQTPENTTPPHEHLPQQPAVTLTPLTTDEESYLSQLQKRAAIHTPDVGITSPVGDAPAVKPPYKRPPRTKAYREAKAAERAALGIGKPGRKTAAELASTEVKSMELQHEEFSEADDLLKALVDKLVALENSAQYASVWHLFFTNGGVWTGPRYIEELEEAIAYLQAIGK